MQQSRAEYIIMHYTDTYCIKILNYISFLKYGKNLENCFVMALNVLLK